MHADLSRLPFSFVDSRTHPFLRVVSQQGRVLLDADVNTQTDLLLYRQQMLAYGLLGPFAALGNAFMVTVDAKLTNDVAISPGFAWSFGTLCECPGTTYLTQAELSAPPPLDPAKEYLLYLHVWERGLNSIEAPEIREVALGGPDTAARTKVVWQVKALELSANDWRPGAAKGATTKKAAMAPAFHLPASATFHPALAAGLAPGLAPGAAKAAAGAEKGAEKAAAAAVATPCDAALIALWLKRLDLFLPPQLEAGLEDAPAAPDLCSISPDARYRGFENQLYRVEVHAGGTADQATFKWSRDNGSVVFPVMDADTDHPTGTTVVWLGDLGRDRKLSLQVGNWVELLNDVRTLGREAHDLLRVVELRPEDQTVVLEGTLGTFDASAAQHPYLRRWDHAGQPGDLKGGAIPVQESPDAATGPWMPLEDGLRVRFHKPDTKIGRIYRHGDHWLIPARTLTGAIEWPYAEPQPPRQGLVAYPVPLAYLVKGAAGTSGWQVQDVRKILQPVTTCAFSGS